MKMTNDLFELLWKCFMREACCCLLLKYPGTWFLSLLRPTTDRQDPIQILPASKYYSYHDRALPHSLILGLDLTLPENLTMYLIPSPLIR